jgi:hypothetical protein
LSKLNLDGYDDQGAVQRLEWLGLNGPSNPPLKTALYANDMSRVEHEKDFIPALEKEARQGWVSFATHIPYWPYRVNPCFMIEQGDKKRRIHHASKQHGERGKRRKVPTNSNHIACMGRWEMGTNQIKVQYQGSKLELVKINDIIALFGMMILLARAMRKRGWEVVVVLEWADLWTAYNQVFQDPVSLWTNGLGYVTRTTKPGYKFGEAHTTDFGQWYSP